VGITNRREKFRDMIVSSLTGYEIVNTYNQSISGEEVFIQIGNDILIESLDNEGFENSFEVRETSFTISYRTMLKTRKDVGLYQREALFEALENIEQCILTIEPVSFKVERSGNYIYNVFIPAKNVWITELLNFIIKVKKSVIVLSTSANCLVFNFLNNLTLLSKLSISKTHSPSISSK